MRTLKPVMFAASGMIFAWLASIAILEGPEDNVGVQDSQSRRDAALAALVSTSQRGTSSEASVESLCEPLTGETTGPDGSPQAPGDRIGRPVGPTLPDSAMGISDPASADPAAGIQPWVRAAEDPSDNPGSFPLSHFDEPRGGLPDLDSVASITCEFDRGLSGGVRSVPTVRAEWAGGPIIFVNAGLADKVVMRGSVGATGSLTGETELRVDTTPNGIHFSGKTPGGHFVLVSIFGLTNSSGDYVAMMSRHNERPVGLHTSLFPGICY